MQIEQAYDDNHQSKLNMYLTIGTDYSIFIVLPVTDPLGR